jgi:pimeloyl-ACP methyl ester carboxylesterase
MTGRVTVGPHQISFTVLGSGSPPVVIEPAFGGTAEQWQEIAGAVAARTTVMTYDRAAYGASSRARDRRTPAEIARDLHGVLDAVGLARPVVLVGHSYGGVCIRRFTEFYDDDVAGMVLVDSSYEGHRQILRGTWPWRIRLAAAVNIPRLTIGRREYRGHADRRSIVREYRALLSLRPADQTLPPGVLGDRPLAVLTRGRDAGADMQESWRRWLSMQEELAQLSKNSRHAVTQKPDHYVHLGEPALVTAAIHDVVDSARTGSLLTDLAGRPPEKPTGT